jgi:FAD/FMN-containing dehydrogenase
LKIVGDEYTEHGPPTPCSFAFMFSSSARRWLAVRAHYPRSAPTRRWTHSSLPKLNSVTEQDLAHFSKFLAPTSILSTLAPFNLPAEDLSPYNNDWIDKYHGKSTTVLKPRTTEEVSKIVKYCWEHRIPIVPQGGNTGLVGGSVPLVDELVINLSNMSKIRSFDPVSGSLHTLIHSPANECIIYQASWLRMPVVFCNH